MIAFETFKKFHFIDLVVIFVLAGITSTFSKLISDLVSESKAYVLFLFVLTFFLSFAVYFIKKAGTGFLFYLITAWFSIHVPDIGVTGVEKIVVFSLAGFLFELFFIILKVEIHNLQIDILLGTALSAMSLPFITGVSISIVTTLALIHTIVNLSLLAFFMGLIGALFSFLAWYYLRSWEVILRYEYRC